LVFLHGQWISELLKLSLGTDFFIQVVDFIEFIIESGTKIYHIGQSQTIIPICSPLLLPTDDGD